MNSAHLGPIPFCHFFTPFPFPVSLETELQEVVIKSYVDEMGHVFTGRRYIIGSLPRI